MCMLSEMTSDDMGAYLRDKSCEEIFVEHKEELEHRFLAIMEISKTRPVPPNMIIRCRDGENMSLPITLDHFRILRSSLC